MGGLTLFRFSSFIQTHAQPLLDLYLYVSSQNYYARTSPSYAAILPWPNQWILPPKLHAAAKSRTEHLGLSSLDLLAVEEEREREHSAAVAAGQIPKSFIRRPRDTVSSLLGRTSRQTSFKLDALTAELFEVLETLLAEKTHLLGGGDGDRLTSLDCWATGYLSLALFPDLPQSWLRESMQSKAPRLTEYTKRMRDQYLGSTSVEPQHVLTTTTNIQHPQPNSQTPHHLPWKLPDRPSISTISSTILATLADSTPILKDIRSHNRLRDAAAKPESGLSPVESSLVSQYATSRKSDLYVSVASVTVGVAAFVGYMFQVGLLRVSRESEHDAKGVGDDDGDTGEMLQAEDFLQF